MSAANGTWTISGRPWHRLPGVVCLGGLPRQESLAIPERHLGLVTAEEHALSPAYMQELAESMERHLDLDALLKLMRPINEPDQTAAPVTEPLTRVRLGVARDQAFCFYYPENFAYLQRFGAELVPFSPLHDSRLPEDLDGLYLGGGYPEVFARELSANISMRTSISKMAAAGLPIYARMRRLDVSEPRPDHSDRAEHPDGRSVAPGS